MTKLSGSPQLLLPGQTWKLPGGKGSITFVGVKQWVSLTITYDPGQVPALVCGMLALAGLLLSFFVRRRRVFVRAVPAASGTGSVVTVGGAHQVRRQRRVRGRVRGTSRRDRRGGATR